MAHLNATCSYTTAIIAFSFIVILLVAEHHMEIRAVILQYAYYAYAGYKM